ncbi:rod shape-determining protein MreC [Arcobacter roscoffensis]|uniref:Rod shape-determining protein MreC n=1 Tax=Arcobacter roscoffensis TaxID=2961520 RepID=A0ABY5E5H8_9BACT|nr:rod shape-determining protein MreC [Arcobacter roscoffensis]UTJ06430.1 rod shape-determining protein MreC [Arcobacter roscoffensis]
MRKFFFVVLFLVVGLSYLFEVDKLVARNFTFLNDIKLSYINSVIDISTTIEKYFDQITTIEELEKENEELKNYKALYLTTQKKLDGIDRFLTTNEQHQTRIDIKQTKVLSYINFNDFTKVWLDYEKKDDTILGLISQDYAAGIVVKEQGRAVALLNGNEKCSYAVFIGKTKTPGILTAKKDGSILIKFIPMWSELNVGDEIVTSGMDNIFVEGLKVGKVKDIQILPQMKTATVEMYANVLKKKYFYVYKQAAKTSDEKEKLNKEEKEEEETTSK